jgi:hypothetical protein
LDGTKSSQYNLINSRNTSKLQHTEFPVDIMSISYDPLEQVDTWFSQMIELRRKSISYSQLARKLAIKPPVRQVCQLLGVQTLAEVFSEDILYRTIKRVAQMLAAEMAAADGEVPLDATSLQPHPSTDTISIPPPIPAEEPIKQLERPAALNSMLELVKKSEALGIDNYAAFLTHADLSQTEMVQSGVITIAPRFKATAAKPEKKVTANSSLREIFQHYVIIKTFKENIEPKTVQEMTIKAVMAFCHDFDVFPKLVSKDEVRLILVVMDVRSTRDGGKKSKALEFDQFLDFLLRLALFAYHKPSTKKLIMRLNNERMPSKLEMVRECENLFIFCCCCSHSNCCSHLFLFLFLFLLLFLFCSDPCSLLFLF